LRSQQSTACSSVIDRLFQVSAIGLSYRTPTPDRVAQLGLVNFCLIHDQGVQWNGHRQSNKISLSHNEGFDMGKQNEKIHLVTAGLLLVSALPSGASEPLSAGKTKNHDCNIPANVRSKVDHCHQVGDFDATEHRGKPGFLQKNKHAPRTKGTPSADPQDSSKDHKKDSSKQKSLKKEIIEIKSDSEPPADTK